jgi:23S rRNA (pseudouridine1915-N3)-methyltransferase
VKLHIVARGRIGRCPEADLVERYLKRIAWPVAVTELPDTGPARLPEPPSPHVTVALDERGRALGSKELAERLGRWRDDAVRDRADLLLSFGAATWPHMLARAMLAEQLYRATSILAGHPYHREG